MLNWGPGAGHPALLPWYVAGTLPAREARRVRAHVARCAECQRQVRDLAAQRAALLGSTRTDHPTAEELVAFTDSDPTVPADRRQSIAAHLAGCPACAHENDLLAEAAERLSAASHSERESLPPGAAAAWGRWAAVAAASIVLIAAGFVAGRTPQPPVPVPGIRALTAATFMPAHRGADEAGILTLPGPWAVTVALPFGAAAAPYRSGIRTVAGEVVVGGADAVIPDREGSVHLYLDSLPAAGEYVLVLEAVAPATETWRYPFSVVAGDVPPSGR